MSTSVPPIQTSFETYLRKSWFHRNWKWFVPALIVLGFVCFGLTVFSLLMYSFRNSDAFQMAMQRARQNPNVIRSIGPVVEPGLLVKGSIHISGRSGHAELSIPVSGERGKGTVFIEANKHGDRWDPRIVEFEDAANGERTDLLHQELPSGKEQ
jgi:hypothetical protein